MGKGQLSALIFLGVNNEFCLRYFFWESRFLGVGVLDSWTCWWLVLFCSFGFVDSIVDVDFFIVVIRVELPIGIVVKFGYIGTCIMTQLKGDYKR